LTLVQILVQYNGTAFVVPVNCFAKWVRGPGSDRIKSRLAENFLKNPFWHRLCKVMWKMSIFWFLQRKRRRKSKKCNTRKCENWEYANAIRLFAAEDFFLRPLPSPLSPLQSKNLFAIKSGRRETCPKPHSPQIVWRSRKGKTFFCYAPSRK